MRTIQTFGEFVTEHRLRRDISLREFANTLSLSPEYICNVEKSRKPAPKDEVLANIAVTLGLDKSETERMYDLAAESKNTISKVPSDLTGFIHENRVIVAALRLAKDVDATDEEWLEFMDKLKRKKQSPGGTDSG